MGLGKGGKKEGEGGVTAEGGDGRGQLAGSQSGARGGPGNVVGDSTTRRGGRPHPCPADAPPDPLQLPSRPQP